MVIKIHGIFTVGLLKGIEGIGFWGSKILWVLGSANPWALLRLLQHSTNNSFESSNLSLGLISMEKVVINDMNAQLSQDFMEWEVEAALKQMAPLKAPGPDGMPPFFYQNYWNLVGNDVTKTILSYLNSATLPHPLNHTFISLIPK